MRGPVMGQPRLAWTLAAVLLTPGCITVVEDTLERLSILEEAAITVALDCSAGAHAPESWNDPCTMLASSNPSPSKAEIDLAVNPTDPDNIIIGAKDLDPTASDCVWSVLQVTKDGGKTWTTVYVGGNKENRVAMLQPFHCVTDPILVFDDAGTAYYALQAYRFTDERPAGDRVVPVVGSTFILARSTDGGLTWDRYVLMAAGDGALGVFHDYPRMAVNPRSGSVHTIWNGIGGSPTGLAGEITGLTNVTREAPTPAPTGVAPWIVTTRDGGQTVDRPVLVGLDARPMSTVFRGLATAEDGAVYVAVFRGNPRQSTPLREEPSPDRVWYLYKSVDDARSFQLVGPMFDTTISLGAGLPNTKFRSISNLELAVDNSDGPHAGRLYATWPDNRMGDLDVLLAWTDDGGLTWSPPTRVNDDNTTTQQFMPRLEVAPDGTVLVLFYDRRWDADDTLLDTTLAWSRDGGATFTNVRLTASSFDGDLGIHQNGFPFIGDYNGLDAVGDLVATAWGDTRTGRAEIAFAKLTMGPS